MFSFFRKSEYKKAFKRALAEIDQELSASSSAQFNNIVERTYKTSAPAEKIEGMSKHTNAINKPETTAVDLKHFKDWRNSSNNFNQNSSLPPKRSFNFDFDEDDEGEQPEIDMPGGTFKKSGPSSSSVDLITAIRESDKEKSVVDTDFDSYFNSIFAEPKQKTVIKEDKILEKPARRKTNLNTLINKSFADAEEESKKKPELKVEVIDFSDEKPKKKSVNRKPRGKNKRRFDADVISSVDWK